MKIFQFILFAAMLVFLGACNKTSEVIPVDHVDEDEPQSLNSDYVFNCSFVQDEETADGWFNETEIAIIEACNKNQLDTTKDIEQNLIGEWELIGHAVGWALPVSLPCAHLKITENELIFTFENATIDIETTHTWSIVEGTRYGEKVLQLDTKPNAHGLKIHSFCSDYMYQDYTPQDGTMYLYQKMK